MLCAHAGQLSFLPLAGRYVRRLHRGFSCSLGSYGWPHKALRYHQLTPICSHFRDCKRFWSRSL